MCGAPAGPRVRPEAVARVGGRQVAQLHAIPPAPRPRQAGQRARGRSLHPAPALGGAGAAAEVVTGLAEFQVETGLFYLPSWTPDQLAGLAFGAFMVACFIGTRRFDEWVAAQQREELGLCARCGGLNDPGACKQEDCPMRGRS